MSSPEEPPEIDPEPRLERRPNPAAPKSRAIGCLLLVLGVAAVVAVPLIGVMPRKVFAVLLAVGACAPVIGIGMILFPWTEEMFALNQQNDFGKMYSGMPLIWKVWFVLSMAVLVGVLLAALVLA